MAPCPFPFSVKRYKNVTVKDRNGIPRLVRQFVGTTAVPCGKCVACRRRKQNEWAFRCMVEAKHSKKSYFVGLTYEDDHLPIAMDGKPTLVKEHLQKHIKSLRDDLGEIKFFGCGEYGDSFGRPHYHYLLFCKADVDDLFVEESIKKRWKYGIVKVDVGVTPANARYCCKYSLKQVGFDYGDAISPFALMSRRPGIGNDFSKDINFEEIRRRNQWIVHDPQGSPVSLPRRYSEAIYSENERLEHSYLLSKVYSVKEDYSIGEYYENNSGNFYQTSTDIILSIEKQFIKSLKNERYEYKFTPFHSRPYERRERPTDDLQTDEF